MNNFITKYEKILEILKQFEIKSIFFESKALSTFKCIELILVDLTAESLCINQLILIFNYLFLFYL